MSSNEDRHEAGTCMDRMIFIVVGLAGSGKTMFCQRLYSWISQEHCKVDAKSGLNSFIYSINLDPAVLNAKMPLNLDIRDHVNYHETMEKYNLGPNGAITTCLNLFMLNIGEHVDDIKKEKYVIIDTPGQIEAFTWSSPGYVLIETLKHTGNIIMVYTVDSVSSHKPAVFMSNMMYAASLMCRYDVRTLCLFNKKDLSASDQLYEWIVDYEKFRESLDDDMFSPTLGSMALYFEEFYSSIKTTSVSSYTGEGRAEFFKAVDEMIAKTS